MGLINVQVLLCFVYFFPPVFEAKHKHLHRDFKIGYYINLELETHVNKKGYPLEHHYITTEDGYILLYHRIRHGKAGLGFHKRRPIFLQHGILNSSGAFMTFRSSLGFVLADAGYDVWMGNSRGNMFSCQHETLDPDEDYLKFWDFSFHEMGMYDLTAGIDYILNMTNSHQLIYMGYSMGTTMYWVLGATQPHYMDKVELMIALAPVAKLDHTPLGRSRIILYFTRFILNIFKRYHILEVMPHTEKIFEFLKIICDPYKFTMWVCMTVSSIVQHLTIHNFKMRRIAEYFLYFPAGASLKSFLHYHQIAAAGRFQEYNYGLTGNLLRYGTRFPPEYNLRNVTSPVYLVHGNSDFISAYQDVLWLQKQFVIEPSIIKVRFTGTKSFSHIDFLYAKGVKRLLHDHLASYFHLSAVKF